MSIPLKWAAGDRCFVRGQIGVVDCLAEESACVKVGERMIFCALSELELVPVSEPSHSAHIPPLQRATITRRADGGWDVLRERDGGGEKILGCQTLEDAFEMIRAVEGAA